MNKTIVFAAALALVAYVAWEWFPEWYRQAEAQLMNSTDNYDAIRGQEQYLIDFYGGAKSKDNFKCS